MFNATARILRKLKSTYTHFIALLALRARSLTRSLYGGDVVYTILNAEQSIYSTHRNRNDIVQDTAEQPVYANSKMRRDATTSSKANIHKYEKRTERKREGRGIS